MSRENKSKYAVLGVLSLGPGSGYDIKQIIEASLSNFWSESYGQIYPLLKELVAEGFATRHTELPPTGPQRHVYTITPAGSAELRRWLTQPAEHTTGRIDILLKLFFGAQVPLDASRAQVQAFRHRHEQLLGTYATIEQWLQTEHAARPDLLYWLMTVSYGQHVSRALLTWCDETLVLLSSVEEDAVPSPAASPV